MLTHSDKDAQIISIPAIKTKEAKLKIASKDVRSVRLSRSHQVLSSSKTNTTIQLENTTTDRIIDYQTLKTHHLTEQVPVNKIITISEQNQNLAYQQYKNINIFHQAGKTFQIIKVSLLAVVVAGVISLLRSTEQQEKTKASIRQAIDAFKHFVVKK